MNAWSEAAIEPLLLGDGAAPWGVGATRRVTLKLLGRKASFREVVVESEPPRRFVYRVFDSPLVRAHRGQIELAPGSAGARLTWRALFELAVPGVGRLLERAIRGGLERSVAALAKLCEGAVAVPLEPDSKVDTAEDALWRGAEAVYAEQLALADALEAAGDPKRWFSRVYAFVTEAQIRACRRGDVRHPAWALRLVRRFHDYYIDNLRRYGGALAGPPEEHWRRAFDKQREPRPGESPAVVLVTGLIEGVRAHIEEDLPRALAEVYAAHYAERCAYARFRGDYLSMGGIFRDSSRRLAELVPRAYVPLHLRAVAAVLPAELQAALDDGRYYNVPVQRERAFERGERIARLLVAARGR
jgi:hypothetical protein